MRCQKRARKLYDTASSLFYDNGRFTERAFYNRTNTQPLILIHDNRMLAKRAFYCL